MPIKIIRIFFLLAALALFFFTSWFSIEFYRPTTTPPDRVIFEVEKGHSVKDIAHSLKNRGIIKKTWPFLLGYRIFYSSQSLKAGEYAIELPISTKSVLQLLTEGSVHLHSITIPEGLIIEEIAGLLDSEGFSKKEDFILAASDPSPIHPLDEKAENLEGYLFPETYRFAKGTSAGEIVSAMVLQFMQVFNQDMKDRAGEIGLSIRETVILASLIEEETSLPEERVLVSAVFHNRLRKGMKLDCDPTIIYVLKKEEQFKDRLRTNDLRIDSPYNTYIYAGLPPGPIANPGRESLEAALYPAGVDYLYFVSKNDGSHHFSRTFREHQNAVNKYQRRR